MRSDDGTITVFVVIVALALLVAAGLVLDGGRLLAARRLAADIAGNAARAGAQAVDERQLRSGVTVVDPVDGATAVARHLAGTSATGDARVAGDTVTVTARVRVRMLLLGIAGVTATTVTATRSARAVQGVTEGG